MDIQKYKPTVDGVLRKLKVAPHNKQDMMQECYMVLLENEKNIEAADFPLGYAESVCRNRILDLWRKEKTQVPEEELDNPKIHHKAISVTGESFSGVTREMLNEAINLLTNEEQSVIERLFFGGYSRMEIATTLGIPIYTVDNRAKSGVKKLKRYFNA